MLCQVGADCQEFLIYSHKNDFISPARKIKHFLQNKKEKNLADNRFWIIKFKKQVSPTEKRKQEGNLLYTEKKF